MTSKLRLAAVAVIIMFTLSGCGYGSLSKNVTDVYVPQKITYEYKKDITFTKSAELYIFDMNAAETANARDDIKNNNRWYKMTANFSSFLPKGDVRAAVSEISISDSYYCIYNMSDGGYHPLSYYGKMKNEYVIAIVNFSEKKYYLIHSMHNS